MTRCPDSTQQEPAAASRAHHRTGRTARWALGGGGWAALSSAGSGVLAQQNSFPTTTQPCERVRAPNRALHGNEHGHPPHPTPGAVGACHTASSFYSELAAAADLPRRVSEGARAGACALLPSLGPALPWARPEHRARGMNREVQPRRQPAASATAATPPCPLAVCRPCASPCRPLQVRRQVPQDVRGPL